MVSVAKLFNKMEKELRKEDALKKADYYRSKNRLSEYEYKDRYGNKKHQPSDYNGGYIKKEGLIFENNNRSIVVGDFFFIKVYATHGGFFKLQKGDPEIKFEYTMYFNQVITAFICIKDSIRDNVIYTFNNNAKDSSYGVSIDFNSDRKTIVIKSKKYISIKNEMTSKDIVDLFNLYYDLCIAAANTAIDYVNKHPDLCYRK